MDENIIKSILPENLYQEFTNLDKKTIELDTCKIPKNSEPIDILQGCTPVMPKFDNKKDINDINDIIGSILSDSPLLKEQNLDDINKNCLDAIQTVSLNLSKSMTDKLNQNQLVPLQKILHNLIEITIYNTVLEKSNKSQYCFNLSLNSDGYYSLIPRIKNYHIQSGIRSYDIHNLFDDLVKSVIVKKDYKNSHNIKPSHIIKYFVNLNDFTIDDIGDGNIDIKAIIHSRLMIFKNIVLRVLNEIYNSTSVVKSVPIYALPISIVETYFNNDISDITKKKLTKKLEILPKTSDEIIEYYKTLNISLQKNLLEYFSIIDMFDIDQIKYELVYEFSNIPCTNSNKGFDVPQNIENKNQYKENLKNIPKDSNEYNIFSPTYWMVWTLYLNIVSLLPNHWTIGFITPVGSPLKLPIVYIHLLTIPIGSTNIIIWLSINGIAISPVVMVVDGKTKSTWKVLFRGGGKLIEESQGSKPVPTGFNIPQSIDGSEAIVDTNINITEIAPMLEDAFPPISRMSPLNPAFLKFLNTCCESGKTMMGLIPL